jgi:hypothetical protein
MAEPKQRSSDASPERAPTPAPVSAGPGFAPQASPLASAAGLYLIASNPDGARAAMGRLDPESRHNALRSLQRIHGNAATQRLLERGPRRLAPPDGTHTETVWRRKAETPVDEAKPPVPHADSSTASPPSNPNGSAPATNHAVPSSSNGHTHADTTTPDAAKGTTAKPTIAGASGEAGGGARSTGNKGAVLATTEKPDTAGARAADGETDAGADAKAGGPEGSIDKGSAEGLLASLATVPVSGFAQALGLAKAALPAIQGKEKADAQAAIPEIDQPTGLPAVAAPKEAKATELPQRQASDPKLATGRAKELEEPRVQEATGPLPASRVSTAAAEPKADDDSGGSWWSWLVDRLKGFFGGLPTTDPNVSTSAGPRQRVDLSGEANPGQNVGQQQQAEQEVAAHRTEADAATKTNFGENDVYPNLPTAKLRPTYKPSPPPAPGGPPALEPGSLPANERAKFNAAAAPWLQEQVKDQQGAYGKEKSVYERATQEAQATGKRQLEEETKRTQTEQEGMRKQVQADVGAERTRWQEENRKIQASVGEKATAKRTEVDRQVQEKVRATHEDADRQLQEAETKAETEKTKAEAEAAAKKKEEEDKPRSWWDRVKGAVSDVFNAIRSAVNAIFDKLRELVKGIIEAARKAVHALIEVARSAIVGLIKAFGEFVKGLVTLALAAFPEAAAKARAWIDGKVKAATDAVNKAADALHKAADTILDGIAKAMDAALGILQAAVNKAIDILEKLALLPFQAMEALAKLVAWVAKNGKFVTSALTMEGGSDKVIDGLKNAIGGMIAEVPAKAYAKLQELAGQFGSVGPTAAAAPAAPGPAPAAAPPIRRQPATTATPAKPAKRSVSASTHLQGILRHLDKGLEHLKNHWWDELKKVGWNLLWPWPAVWQDLKDIWKEVKAGFEDAYHLRIGKVIDHILAIDQKFNSILGNLYGWFFIASVLIGAIIGAFFGGAGAIPGALAGAAFAGEVGEALVVALIATETAVIVKSVADLAIGNDTKDEDEEDYGKIGGSTLTIAITAAMMLLGEIAAKLAKSIWEGVSGLFRGGEKGPEVKVEVKPGEGDGAAGTGTDTPESKPGGEPADAKPSDDVMPPDAANEGVAAERPTADGHKIKVLEDGRIFVCTTCEELRFKYGEEIKGSEDFQRKLTDAEGTADAQAKADKAEALQKELAEARKSKMGGEDLPTKLTKLDEIVQSAKQALGKLKEKLDAKVGRLQRTNGALKGEIEAEIRQLDPALLSAEGDAVAAKELEDPVSIDEAREKLDDIRARSEQLEKKLDDAVPDEPEPTPEPDDGGGAEVDRALTVKASRPEARVIQNPADRFPRSQALAIDEVQTVMNDLYREGAAYGDGSTAYMAMLEQAEAGPGRQPISVVEDTLHGPKAQQYSQGLGDILAERGPNLPAEAQQRVQLEIDKMNEALRWAEGVRNGVDPAVPRWARPWAEDLAEALQRAAQRAAGGGG